MDDLSLILESLINSEVDDMILDLVYDIHSSLKGISSEDVVSSTHHETRKTCIEKQTCACPNCGQTNLIAIRFAYHLAKCLGERRRAARPARDRPIDCLQVREDNRLGKLNVASSIKS